MARAVLIWSKGDGRRVAELKENGANIIGRAPGSDILLEDQTISRRHAELRVTEGAFVLENVSKTNVAKVNGATIDRPVPLSDQDSVELGALRLTFHDLQAGDRISGPMCSNCTRENMPADKDCWYCGTSLVNAPTAILAARKVACRIVSDGGDVFDIHQGEAFVVLPGQGPQVVLSEDQPAAAATIQPSDSAPGAVLAPQGASLTVNGQPASTSQPLKTGDEVATEGARFTIVVR